MIPGWRWPLALLVAAGLHVLLLVALPEPDKPPGVEAEGERGLLIALPPAGGTPGDAGAPEIEEIAEPEPVVEPDIEPVTEAEPEPEIEPEPEAQTEPEPVAEPQPEIEPEPVEAPIDDAAEEPLQEPVSDIAGDIVDTATAAAAGVDDGIEHAEDGGADAGGGDPGAVDDYHARLQAHLARHRHYPRQAQRRREEGVVMLAFTAHADGSVSEARIAEGSGSRLLDEAALDMLERATPLPEFTDGMVDERLRIEVPVSYNLR